jgi:hypothetical protein
MGRDAYDTSKYGADGPANQNCVANPDDTKNCSTAALAEDDLYRWIAAVKDTKNGLPGGPAATVKVTPGATGAPDLYEVSVTWREAGEDLPLTYKVNTEIVPVSP